jgi:hypothetical protein
MVLRRSIIGLALGLFVGAACLYIALIAGGGGHGTYMPAKVLFPFCMLSVVLGHSITLPFISLAFLQFPLYGLVLGAAFRSDRFRSVVTSLSVLHILVSVVVFAFSDPSFSP